MLIPFLLITLVWGSTWLVIKDQLTVVPPSWSVAYRFAVGGVATMLWAASRGERLWLDARGYALAALLGLTQFVLNFNFVYRAEQHITSGIVAVAFALLLVPNAVLARIILGQRMGRQLLVGSAVAIAGVALLFVHEARLSAVGPHEVVIGIALSLAAVLAASIANVLQATGTAKAYPMATLIAWAMLLGAAMNAGIGYAVAGPPVIDPRPLYFAGLLYLGVIGSAFAFSLYYALIRTIGPAKAAYTSVLVPVIAMLLSTLFEGYRWSWLAAGGGVLVVAGLVLALRARRPNR